MLSDSLLLPCLAFLSTMSDSISVTREEIEEQIKSGKSPFAWKESFSLESIQSPTHLGVLKEYEIPYIVDIHAHFFPEVVMKLIWRWFDSAKWGIQYRFSEVERLSFLGLNQIQYFTTLNYAHKANMAHWLNDWTFANYKNWEGAIPFGTFFPEEGVLQYVKKAVEEYGFKGFKLHCEVSKLDLNRFDLVDTFNYLQESKIPIVIHSGHAPLPGEFTGIKYFARFMESFPELAVIVAHMGAYEVKEYVSLMDIYPNLRMDTTMVFVDFLATGRRTEDYFPLLDKYSDRIYFGSDFPNIPYTLSHPIGKLLSAPLMKSTKQKILSLNAVKLFGLDAV